MSNQERTAAWCAAVARAKLDSVTEVTRCVARGEAAGEQGRGLLHIGPWSALLVPDELLGTEFDPDSELLIHIRYADYPVVTLSRRALMPTATVRFDDQLMLVGRRTPMMLLHELWAEDHRFNRSIDESWA